MRRLNDLINLTPKERAMAGRVLRRAITRLGQSAGSVKGTQPLVGLMGNGVDMTGDDTLVSLINEHAEIVTSGNNGKWKIGLLADTPTDQYDLDYTDYDAVLAAFPEDALKRHHTVYWSKDSYYPDTYDFSTEAGRITQNDLYAAELFGNKYSSTFDYIDVWNEPANAAGALKDYDTGEAITLNEIGNGFASVRSNVAAGTKLGVNEFGMESNNAKTDGLVSAIQTLQGSGVVIDYVGFEGHLNCDTDLPTEEQMYAAFMKFKDIGLEVLVTELDIRIGSLQGTYLKRAKTQQEALRRLMAAARRAEVHSVGWWGVTDLYSWLYDRYLIPYPQERPLPFDNNYRPKALWHITTGDRR